MAVLLYYITDRRGFAGTEAAQCAAVLDRIAAAARAGVEYIQLREKDLLPRELERLAGDAVRAVRENSATAKLLINGRADTALACGADGVHLPSGELSGSEVRALWRQCRDREPLIGVSAHSISEVRDAELHSASFAVLAPVFGKVGEKIHGKLQLEAKAIGLDALRDACCDLSAPANVEAPERGRFAVLALGGVDLSNAGACLQAGAAGVAGIRLFQNGDIFETVKRLREMEPEFGTGLGR